jgi:hypothetical protein
VLSFSVKTGSYVITTNVIYVKIQSHGNKYIKRNSEKKQFACFYNIFNKFSGLQRYDIAQNYRIVQFFGWSRASSGSIVSGYGLYDQAIEVRSPAGAKDFSSILCVQTGSGAHPSCTIGTGGPLPGGKARTGRDTDHSPPSITEVENENELYLLSPQASPWRVAGLLYFLLRCLSQNNLKISHNSHI